MCQFSEHGEDLPRLLAGAGLTVTSEPARLAARRPLGVFRFRRGRPTGPECDRVGIRRRGTRSTSVPSADDDQDFALWLLCGSVFLAPDREEISGGYRVPGNSGGPGTPIT